MKQNTRPMSEILDDLRETYRNGSKVVFVIRKWMSPWSVYVQPINMFFKDGQLAYCTYPTSSMAAATGKTVVSKEGSDCFKVSDMADFAMHLARILYGPDGKLSAIAL